LGLRQLSMAASAVVYPLAVVAVIFVGSGPLARVARTPLTYSWRVCRPAGTGADQTLPLPFVQPVIGIPPLTSGRAPAAAVPITSRHAVDGWALTLDRTKIGRQWRRAAGIGRIAPSVQPLMGAFCRGPEQPRDRGAAGQADIPPGMACSRSWIHRPISPRKG